jgi:hypothetical protein
LESSALPTQLHWLHIAYVSDFDPSLPPTVEECLDVMIFCCQSSNPWKADSLHALLEALHADPRFGWFDIVNYGVDVGIIAPSIPFFGSQESPVGI